MICLKKLFFYFYTLLAIDAFNSGNQWAYLSFSTHS